MTARVAIVTVLLAACDQGGGGVSARATCVPGSVEFCGCPGGAVGTQVCAPWMTYEECVCPVDAGPLDGGDIDAGSTPADAEPDAVEDPWWTTFMPDTTGCDTTDAAPVPAGTECSRATVECVLACPDHDCAISCYPADERAACQPCMNNAAFWCASRNGCDWLWQGYDCCREIRCGGIDTECLVRSCNPETAALHHCWASVPECADAPWACAPGE